MPHSRFARRLVCLTITIIVALSAATAIAAVPPTADRPWRALHLINISSDAALQKLGDQLPELAKLGINCLFIEVDYSYAFESHPELRQGKSPISKEGAKAFRAACDKNGMELVPQFQCLGHQSWKEHTSPLLTKYPELDLTPGAFPNNKGIYCREWDPLNPKTNQIIFPLIDELIDAFGATAFHVGMDEVFLLASDKAPSTKGHDPADVFAKAVTDLHDHIVGERRLTMLMWADRLIDGPHYNMGEWEASKVGTAAAVDKIPKDIILCPWHYELREHYESLPMFMDKGFRILPASWKKTDATLALIRDAQAHQKAGLLVGHIFTTWSQHHGNWADFEPLAKGLELLNSNAK